MERMPEIETAADLLLRELLEQRMDDAAGNFSRQQLIWQQAFQGKVAELLTERDEETENIIISYLYSSTVTGSNDFQMALYGQEIHVDINPPCVYYQPEFLFIGIEADIERIKDFLFRRFIRLSAAETEEIRRQYLIMVYQAAKGFFRRMLPDDHQANLAVWFGGYMDDGELIGTV